jgi:tetratricopeptide (TPR) repeat protein
VLELNPVVPELNPVSIGFAYAGKSEQNTDTTKAIDPKFDEVQVHNTRGIAYSENGNQDKAIATFTKAIALNPDFAEAYYDRGEAWLHLGQWERAKSDLTTARNMEVNLITAFDYLYEDAQDFEQTNGVKVPEDIAAMLSAEVIAMRKTELQQQIVERVEQLSAEQLEAVIDYHDRAPRTERVGSNSRIGGRSGNRQEYRRCKS